MTDGDEFRLWKIIDITFDKDANTQSYSFNSNFAEYFSNKNVTIDNFMKNYDQNSDEYNLNKLLSGLPQYIKEKSLDANNSKSITYQSNSISQLEAGGYYVEVVASTRVYQVMMASIIPNVNENGEYCYNNVTIDAKSTYVGVEKQVKNSDDASEYGKSAFVQTTNLINSGDDKLTTVNYKITINVPKYVEYTAISTLKLEDTLPNGITYKDGTIKIKGKMNVDAKEVDLDADNDYAYTIDTNKITVDFKDKYDRIKNYDEIIVTYDASVGEGVSVKNSDETNGSTVKYSYDKYPYFTSENENNIGEQESTAYVYTYGLKINKVDRANPDKKLKGAVFDLYREALNGEKGESLSTGESRADVKAVLVRSGITTDENGEISLDGLKDIKYYIVEKKAPSGYQLDKYAKECDLSISNSNNIAKDGYLKIIVYNSSATLVLPLTGATGLVVFSLIGLLIMTGAVVFIIKARRNDSM